MAMLAIEMETPLSLVIVMIQTWIQVLHKMGKELFALENRYIFLNSFRSKNWASLTALVLVAKISSYIKFVLPFCLYERE